jgi:hypothetical protein
MIYSAETHGQKSRPVVVKNTGVLLVTAYCIAYVLSQTQINSEINSKIQRIARWEVKSSWG